MTERHLGSGPVRFILIELRGNAAVLGMAAEEGTGRGHVMRLNQIGVAPWKMFSLLAVMVIAVTGCSGGDSSNTSTSNTSALSGPDPVNGAPALSGAAMTGLADPPQTVASDPPADPPTLSSDPPADPPTLASDPPGDPPGDPPVPEPSTLSLLASGMAGLAIVGRTVRRRRGL